MGKAVCVFASSSEVLDPAYREAAAALGALLGGRGWTTVFGGGTRGLMGAMARAVQEHGGRVVAVIPEKLNLPGIVFEEADELIVTADLRERKARMDALADAYVALPGGFGTLEETLEALTLKQLQYHGRPVVFLNTLGFYDRLLAFFDHLVEEGFVQEEHRGLYHVAEGPGQAVDFLEAYEAPVLPDKFS